jgi:ribokinase
MTDAPSICVVGSANLDVITRCEHLPGPGETVLAHQLLQRPGGKGANQALSAQRAGAQVTLIAALGQDDAAVRTLELLRQGGVDLTQLARRPGDPTGTALITVADDGENTIVVAPGANGTLGPHDLPAALNHDAVLCQLEVPLAAVQGAADRAAGLFCLNASPVRELPPSVLSRVDVLLVNEGEDAALGRPSVAGRVIRGLVVVTLGRAGALIRIGDDVIARSPSYAVQVRDTVGAGDCFAGAFVTALARRESPQEALRYACAAGALATTAVGAQESLPTDAQIRALMRAV